MNKFPYIPVMNSTAGLTLTGANWQETQVQTLSIHLDLLLLKPGYEVLLKIQNLNSYWSWSGSLILNASSCIPNTAGDIDLKSPYDGSRIQLNCEQLVHLILYLKPSAVLLPPKILSHYPQIWECWDDRIFPVLNAQELDFNELKKTHGAYVIAKSNSPVEFKKRPNLPTYILGCADLPTLSEWSKEDQVYVEWDTPAALALQGLVLTSEGILSLVDENQAEIFKKIDEKCNCPTCNQQLTKAYLHHLYLHTPLLCQRFLIQHNIFYSCHS